MEKDLEYYMEVLRTLKNRSYGDDYSSQISQIINKLEKEKNTNLAIHWIADALMNSFVLDFNVHEKKETMSQEEFMKRTDIILKRLRTSIIDSWNQQAISSGMDF